MSAVQHSKREILAAMETDREAFPKDTTCAECGCIWMAHMGKLCPSSQPPNYEELRRIVRMVAAGELPHEMLTRPRFVWRGSFFVPLLDCGDGTATFIDLAPERGNA